MIDPEAVGDRTRQQAKQVIYRKKKIQQQLSGQEGSVFKMAGSHNNIAFCLWFWLWLFSRCFARPQYMLSIRFNWSCMGFGGMRVEKSSMNGSDSEAVSLLECLPLFPYACLPVNQILFWLCFFLHGSPHGCGSSHCPLADLLWNHLWNRSKIFRRADGGWWKWSCQLHWMLQIKIHRFGYGCLGAVWWWWLFLIPSLHVFSNPKFVSTLYYSCLFWKSFSFWKSPVHEHSSLILYNLLLYTLVFFIFRTLLFASYINYFVVF